MATSGFRKGGTSKDAELERIAAKTQSFEYFLNDVLREELKEILERRDVLYQKVAEYMEQENIFEKLTTIVATKADDNNASSSASSSSPSMTKKTLSEQLRTKVDIGCNFYVQGEIPTPLEVVSLDIGCGIWMEMTIGDAISCCKQRINFFNKRIELLTKQELEVKAKINVVLRGLQELQQLPNAKPPEEHEPAFPRFD